MALRLTIPWYRSRIIAWDVNWPYIYLVTWVDHVLISIMSCSWLLQEQNLCERQLLFFDVEFLYSIQYCGSNLSLLCILQVHLITRVQKANPQYRRNLMWPTGLSLIVIKNYLSFTTYDINFLSNFYWLCICFKVISLFFCFCSMSLDWLRRRVLQQDITLYVQLRVWGWLLQSPEH